MENINVIHLCGGIGNQLFQYAFGRVQKECGVNVRYNPEWYNKTQEPPRPYRLNKFCVDVNISPPCDMSMVRETKYSLGYLRRENCYFVGYWQYLDYYKNIIPILQEEFKIRKEFHTEEFLQLREQIITKSSVSLHVRRQDYIGRAGFGVLSIRYYFKALSKVEGDVYVFSDDMPWCMNIFKEEYFGHKFIFVDLEDYQDFELMRSCDIHILANSTFSWWAAILDDNPDKISFSWF